MKSVIQDFLKNPLIHLYGLASIIALFAFYIGRIWGPILVVALVIAIGIYRSVKKQGEEQKDRYETLLSKCKKDREYFYNYTLKEVSLGVVRLFIGLAGILCFALLLLYLTASNVELSNLSRIFGAVVVVISYLIGTFSFLKGIDHLILIKDLALDILGEDNQLSEQSELHGEPQT